MSQLQHPSKYLHGDGRTVVLDARFIAWLDRLVKLSMLDPKAREAGEEFRAQLMAMRLASQKFTASASGSKVAASAEAGAESSVMKVRQVADALGVTDSRVRQELRDGHLQGKRVGREWEIHRSDLDDYRANRTS